MKNLSAGRIFFESLYDRDVDGHLEIRSIPSRRQTFHTVDDAWQHIQDHTGNIYFGVGLRKEQAGGDDNICHIPAVWAEFDFKDFGGSKRVAEMAIKKCSLKPSIINLSGNGYHCYWKLDGGLDIIPQNVDYVKKILYGFASAVGGDTKSTNLERILRVPGTQNLKDPNNPKEVLCVYNHSRVYNIVDFEGFMATAPKKYEAQKVVLGGSLGNGPPSRLSADLERDQWLRMIWDGKRVKGDTSRSGNDFALAIRLFNIGYTPKEVGECLLAYEHGKAPIEQQRYINFTVGRAMAYAKKQSTQR